MANFVLNQNDPKNKHSPTKRNYNTGIVGVRVQADRFCPFSPEQKQTTNLIFNGNTLGAFSEEEKRKFSYVAGEQGLYLKEKYILRSNILKVSSTSSDEELSPDMVNPFKKACYSKEQTWYVTAHPMVEQNPVKFSEYNDPACCNSKGKWQYDTEKVSVENQPDTEECYFTQNSSDPDNPSEDPQSEVPKDNIIYPMQINAASTDGSNGIHWRVTKQTALFQGEDFFIDFIKKAKTVDINNINPIKDWQLSGFNYLNAWYEPQNLVRNLLTDPPPENQGVVRYNYEIVDQANPNIVQYSADEGTRSFYDFNKQAYYIVELGCNEITPVIPTNPGTPNNPNNPQNPNAPTNPQGQGIFTNQNKIFVNLNDQNLRKYYIIIGQNYYPTLLVVRDGVSYCLSVYKDISGDDLITKRDKFRMTVRNHLGKIVITFSGNENKPWVINPIQLKFDDIPFLVVPKQSISIWGGNISAGFIFGPLQYEPKFRFVLPGGYKEHGNPFQYPAPYKSPLFTDPTEAGFNRVSLELFPGKIGASGIDNKIKFDTLDLNGHANPNGAGRGRIYSCDAQLVKEYIYTDDGVNGTVNLQTTRPDYQGYDKLILKEFMLEDTLSQIILSKILLKDNSFPTTNNQQSNLLSTRFLVFVDLVPGDHTFENTNNNTNWILKGCKTPVIVNLDISNNTLDSPNWRTRPEDILKELGKELSNRLLEYSENWSSQDYFKIEHTASLRFLWNGVESIQNQELRDELLSILDRNLYIAIEVMYAPCSNAPCGNDNSCNEVYTKPFTSFYPPGSPYYNTGRARLFTGIISGGRLNEKAGERILECSVKDYSMVLEHSKIFNSPFFDGMRDINAIYELLQIAGFRSFDIIENIEDAHINSLGQPDLWIYARPAWLLRNAARSSDVTYIQQIPYDLRYCVMDTYALPQSYGTLTAPNALRFQDGSNIFDAISSFAKKANKMFYFDEHGVFHYENRKFDEQFFGICDIGYATNPDFFFTVSPFEYGQLIFESVTREADVSSVYNDIHMVSATPNFEIIIGHDIDIAGITGEDYTSIGTSSDPGIRPSGWLGYKKTFLQMDGIFGSEQAVQNIICHYSRFYRPPKKVKFSTLGVPMRALDICNVSFGDGMNQNYVITSVSSSIDPKRNVWWMDVEGEWIEKTQSIFCTSCGN